MNVPFCNFWRLNVDFNSSPDKKVIDQLIVAFKNLSTQDLVSRINLTIKSKKPFVLFSSLIFQYFDKPEQTLASFIDDVSRIEDA